jgi:hypothetical protein
MRLRLIRGRISETHADEESCSGGRAASVAVAGMGRYVDPSSSARLLRHAAAEPRGGLSAGSGSDAKPGP